MRFFLITASLCFYFLFLPGVPISSAYAQKIKYVDPQKENKEIQKRILKENKIKERRRQQLLKKKGIGEKKKDRRQRKAEKRKRGSSNSYLDRVLTEDTKVSPDKKKEAYSRDRKLTKAKSRQKSKMARKKVKRRKPPKVKH